MREFKLIASIVFGLGFLALAIVACTTLLAVICGLLSVILIMNAGIIIGEEK